MYLLRLKCMSSVEKEVAPFTTSLTSPICFYEDFFKASSLAFYPELSLFIANASSTRGLSEVQPNYNFKRPKC